MSKEIDVLTTHTPIRTWAGDIGFILKQSFRLDRAACILTFAETLDRILSALTPAILGLMVAAITRHDRSLLIVSLSAVLSMITLTSILSLIGIHTRIRLQEKVEFWFDEQIARISGTAPTLEHLERPEYAEQLQILHDSRGTLGNAFNSFANFVHNLSSPITGLAVAIGADWRMIFLAIAGLCFTLQTKPSAAWEAAAEKVSAESGKLSTHLQDLVINPTAGAEMRVLGARPTILRRLNDAVRGWRRPSIHAEIKVSALDIAFQVFYFVVAGLVLGWITLDLIHGRVGIGHYTAALAATTALRSQLTWVVPNLVNLSRVNRSIRRFRWLEGYAAEIADRHNGTLPPPAMLATGITLENVTFTYPGSDKVALDDVCLHIPAGTVLAVVGENGAGKSTLVKALTGMYDITSGRVLVDGVPLTDLDLAQWRARCSGAFQDHYPFEFTARDAIGIGDLAHRDDDEHIHNALDRAAASDILSALPQGLDTQLGPQWEDGVGLSGGQWQRLAIARGMMRDDPLLLVLDEPTSALDAATEDRLFTSYTSAARKAQRRGAITILVTHRFSTVSAADSVIVMDHGRIIEQGTHSQLLAKGGTYADLYSLQATGYRDRKETDR